MADLRPEITGPQSPGQDATLPIVFGGHDFIADRSGALYWPAERTLIVADLHLEKGSAFATRGRLLPPYDTRETLQRLGEVIGRFQPARVLALGDSLHDRGAETRIDAVDLVLLAALQKSRDWLWITGNHDPEIAPVFAGRVAGWLEIAGIRLQHEPASETAVPEISGHLHPAARLVNRGVTLRRRCFVADRQRLILPAFGAFTGGLNVLDAAFQPLFDAENLRVWMLGADGVYPVPPAQLAGD